MPYLVQGSPQLLRHVFSSTSYRHHPFSYPYGHNETATPTANNRRDPLRACRGGMLGLGSPSLDRGQGDREERTSREAMRRTSQQAGPARSVGDHGRGHADGQRCQPGTPRLPRPLPAQPAAQVCRPSGRCRGGRRGHPRAQRLRDPPSGGLRGDGVQVPAGSSARTWSRSASRPAPEASMISLTGLGPPWGRPR
jgi:hypothetical protein